MLKYNSLGMVSCNRCSARKGPVECVISVYVLQSALCLERIPYQYKQHLEGLQQCQRPETV